MVYWWYMSGGSRQGFTVIEVMLFLAISGLLVMGILGGTGVAINVQRYKDATNSLFSYFQSQYDLTINTQNTHTNLVACADGSVTASATAVTVGSSLSCFVTGRLITVSDNGKRITAQWVYAARDAHQGDDDITALTNAGLFTSSVADTPEVYTPEWGTRLNVPKQATSMDGWQLLIVRSPSTGTVRTFTTMSGDIFTQLSTARAEVTACLDPVGLVLFAPSGITIVQDAANGSGVKLVGQGVC